MNQFDGGRVDLAVLADGSRVQSAIMKPCHDAESAAVSSAFGEWLSLVEHLVRDQGVGGSNPLSPTNFLNI
jgi:hypothetical protein